MKARTTSTPSSSDARRPASRRSARALAALLALAAAVATPAAAQHEAPAPNAVLLVAKPRVQDPNFRRSVVLVTQAQDGSTVGVILNRPTRLQPTQLLPRGLPVENYKEAVFFGGPVMPTTVIALFEADAPPAAAAFAVLRGVYLSMHHANISALLEQPGRRYRLYAGFAGWAPRQLENELKRDDWFVLPARHESLFRRDTEHLWNDLVAQASGQRTGMGTISYAGWRMPSRAVIWIY